MVSLDEKLVALGWSSFFEQQLTVHDQALGVPARIIEEQRGMYRVASALPQDPPWAEMAGKLLHQVQASGDFPAVGDWVIIRQEPGADRATILRCLSRQSKISRQAPGTDSQEQVMAANVDVAFILTSLNQDLSLNRIERYLAVVRQGGVTPIVLLTKADLGSPEENQKLLEDTSARLGEVVVRAISARQGQGLSEVLLHVPVGKTGVLLGSSGVGKSTLINGLAGKSVQVTQAVRDGDDKGRHTTTSRRLIVLTDGGMIIDTPGIRELQLWNAGEGLENAFEDIEALAQRCRFADCKHETEPKCAVQEALANGQLTEERRQNYLKLQRELEYHRIKNDKAAMSEKNKKSRKYQKAMRDKGK